MIAEDSGPWSVSAQTWLEEPAPVGCRITVDVLSSHLVFIMVPDRCGPLPLPQLLTSRVDHQFGALPCQHTLHHSRRVL